MRKIENHIQPNSNTYTGRIVPFPYSLSRADASPLGKEVRRPLLYLARESALCGCLGSGYRQGFNGDEWCCVFLEEGDVHQEPNCVRWSWDYCYALQ